MNTTLDYFGRYRVAIQKTIRSQEAQVGTLFSKQIEAVEAEALFLSNPHISLERKRTGYSRIATGGGKTVIFGSIINYTRSLVTGRTLKTLVVVPTTRLIAQTKEEFEDFFPDLDVRVVDEDHKEYGGKEVTITTYDSFRTGVKSGKFRPDSFGLLVLDEAHNALAQGTSEIVRKFKKSIIRGYTATPEYDDEKNLIKLLGYEICNIPAPELVEAGRLSSFKSVLVHSSKSVDFDEIGFGAKDYKQSQLEKAINCEAVINTAIDLYLNYRDPETGDRFFGRKLRLNCISIDHANDAATAFHEALKDKLPEELMPAVAIHSEVEKQERKEIDKKRLSGGYLVTSQVKCLDEGDNDPSLEIIFNLAPTASRVRAEQRGGRALRLHPEDPGMMKYVVDFTFDGPKPQHPPVLFAEVMDAILVNNPQRQKRARSPEGGGRPPYVKDIPDFPPYTVSSTIEELAAFLQHYQAVQPREFAAIAEETKVRLVNEKIRTGVGPVILLRGREDIPSRLNPSMIANWQAGTARRAFKEHVDYVLGLYSTLPETEKKVRLTDEMAKLLDAEMERTGTSFAKIEAYEDKPAGFNVASAFNWRGEKKNRARMVPERYWNWLISKYADLPNDPRPRIPLTREMSEKISTEMERTGYGATTVLQLPGSPEGLTSSIVISLSQNKSKSVIEDYYKWLIYTLAAQPDTSKIEITEEKRQHLLAEKKRTGVGFSKLLQKPDKPDGLTPQIVSRWGDGFVKSAEKIYYDYVVASYRVLPDTVPTMEFTDEMQRFLRSEKQRTGIGIAKLSTLCDNSYGINPSSYSNLLSEPRTRQTIDENVWRWFVQNYAAQRSIIDPGRKSELDSEIKRTGVGLKGFCALNKDRFPEGLTEGMVVNWSGGGRKRGTLLVQEEHFNFVLELYREIQTKAPEVRIKLTDQMRDALLSEKKRTGTSYKGLRIALTGQMKEALRSERERTNVSYGGLKGADLPPDLILENISSTWLKKGDTTRTVNQAHYEAVMRCYSFLPTVIKVPVTEEKRSYLVREFERTGVGPDSLLKSAQDVPEGLTGAKIQCWKDGRAQFARADHYDYVEEKYATLVTRLPLTPEMSAHLMAEVDRTGYTPAKIEALTKDSRYPLTAYSITSLRMGQASGVSEEAWNYIVNLYASLPDVANQPRREWYSAGQISEEIPHVSYEAAKRLLEELEQDPERAISVNGELIGKAQDLVIRVPVNGRRPLCCARSALPYFAQSIDLIPKKDTWLSVRNLNESYGLSAIKVKTALESLALNPEQVLQHEGVTLGRAGDLVQPRKIGVQTALCVAPALLPYMIAHVPKAEVQDFYSGASTFLTATEINRVIGVDHQRIREFLKELLKKPDELLELDGKILGKTRDLIEERVVKGRDSAICSRDLLPYIKAALAPLQEKGDWISINDISRGYKVRWHTVRDLMENYASDPNRQIVFENMAFGKAGDVFQRRLSGRRPTTCCRPDLLPYLLQELGAVESKGDWLSANDIARRTGKAPQTINDEIEKLVQILIGNGDTNISFNLSGKMKEEKIKDILEKRQTGSLRSWCIRPDFIAYFEDRFGLHLPQKEGWLTSTEVWERAKYDAKKVKPVTDQLRRQFENNPRSIVPIPDARGKLINMPISEIVQKRRSGGYIVTVFNPVALPYIEEETVKITPEKDKRKLQEFSVGN